MQQAEADLIAKRPRQVWGKLRSQIHQPNWDPIFSHLIHMEHMEPELWGLGFPIGNWQDMGFDVKFRGCSEL